MIVTFFIEKDASQEEMNEIRKELEKSSLISHFQFISTKQARDLFLKKFPELQGVVNNMEINPFPPSYEATLKKNISPTLVNPFIQKIKKIGAVEETQYNQSWVEKMQSLSRLVQAVGFFLGGILILASFFIISNVIKLNVMARKNEIQILRLVGATNTFIRIPFLAEGTALGIIGGGLSLVFLLLLIQFFPLYLGSTLGALNELIRFRFLSLFQSLLVVFSGGLIGFLGSLTSISPFLKT